MKSFDIDGKNDLVLNRSGNVGLVSGIDAVVVACKQAAQARIAEMAFAYDEGLPMNATVFGSSPNLAQYEAALRARLLAVDNVTKILSLTVKRDGASLSYTAEILTAFGAATLG